MKGLLLFPNPRRAPSMTSGAKLDKMRELANEMAQAAAKEKGEGWEQLARWSERIHALLDT